ncbi:hypothetical protein HWB81_gp39 [Bacillus phage Wes44]|uniref:Uncharacterized protein n=2 Tax=Carmenvirus TaxID=2842583 RepID=A0A2I7QIN6_9CAUD|nr:hypothetical protein HWB53_gp36 [Bacillus phage Carmen17]YP_009840453.1 hypothetical protein HWB81_gp39 [Bacillus phage Wes44]AUR81260.1 hypothetical protein [Bacillus phage Carmen17]AXN58348.1 hypothetical protein Wes44_39 [Bacillus phage Wes44]
MMDVNEFLDLTEDKSPIVSVKFGKIPANYTTGRPTVILDGMTIPTIKRYPYIGSYVPKANARVMIVQGVIIGDIK